MGRFDQKVAFITGAASGIGKAAALLFAEEGAALALVDRNREGLEATGRAVEGLGPPPLLLEADLAHYDECVGAVEQAAERFERLDVLSLNAAIALVEPLTLISPEQWELALDVNLSAPLWLTRAAVAHLPPGSSVVNTSSVSGLRALWGGGSYGVTKAALNMLTRALARELGPRGIRVNAVLPATVATGFGGQPRPGDATYEAWVVAAAAANPLGRLACGEDIARLILFLASEEAAHITGAEIVADGGFSA